MIPATNPQRTVNKKNNPFKTPLNFNFIKLVVSKLHNTSLKLLIFD